MLYRIVCFLFSTLFVFKSGEDEPAVNVNPSQPDSEDPYGGSTDEGGDTEDEIEK